MMLRGYNLIGQTASNEGQQTMKAFSPLKKIWLSQQFYIATHDEINRAVDKAAKAFEKFKIASSQEKILFLNTIAQELIVISDLLIEQTILETGLSEKRLKGELNRTINQIQLFAEVLQEGSWVEAIIDTAIPERKPLPRPDLRKMLIPLGPVVVFGAANFPFAFSTAGGDTISAFAAGNTVIVKAHPSHLGTNELVANAIGTAIQKCNLPDGIFSSLNISNPEDAILLVKHSLVKAVAFTGSYNAGMAIYKAAVNERQIPIPVFAEMSSANPILILPEKLKQDDDVISTMIASSITLDAGQFCTNPGLLFLIRNKVSKDFIKKLSAHISTTSPSIMLNDNICKNYYSKRNEVADQNGVISLFKGDDLSKELKSSVTLLLVKGESFINNPGLQSEIFGPATLIIECADKTELINCIYELQGQLTASVMAIETDINEYRDCIFVLKSKVGRVIFNGVPTGVEVSHAMMHGGPFPATTDIFSTSVGSDAIKRFVRPICFQDCPSELLPEALQNENVLNIMRKINGHYTRDLVSI
jgi:2,5-dioxopentanoate dehydrogenase